MSKSLKFLEAKTKGKTTLNNKSCYYKKGEFMLMINCGKGVLEALKAGAVLAGVKQVYQIITHYSEHATADLKDFFAFAKQSTGNTPILIENVALNNKILKKLGIDTDTDCIVMEPLKNNIKWVNFLAVPHSDKSLSCPVELDLDGKKIFYAGETHSIPFLIQGYDEYYFDFAEKESEYFLGPNGIKNLVKKNKIKKNQLWLVHFTSLQAVQMAQKAGLQVAKEELAKFTTRTKQEGLAKGPQKAPAKPKPTTRAKTGEIQKQ